MFYNSLAVSLTNKCNAFCDYCGCSCGPKNSGFLKQEDFKRIIMQVPSIKRIKLICFTGGEPFLFLDNLKECISLSYKYGYNTSCNTNAYFFNSDSKKVEDYISYLAMNGLKFLHITTDSSHLKYINIDNIEYALKISKKIGLVTTLRIGVLKKDVKSVHNIIDKLGYSLFGTYIELYPLIPIGRAKLLDKDNFYFNIGLDKLYCKRYSSIFINYDGNAYACCSGIISDNMKLGNINDYDLSELIQNARRNVLYKHIFIYGFKDIIEIIRQENLLKLKEKYVCGCQLCDEIFNNDDIYNCIVKHLSYSR